MEAKPQMSGEGFNQLAGMSKSQLYELMTQMKLLIEQNHQQAKQILIENPMLTKALFQAQIMLGMVQPTQPAKAQQVLLQQQSAQPGQQSNAQSSQSLPVQPGPQAQASSSQPARQQQTPQPSVSLPSTSLPSLNFQSQTMPSVAPHSTQHSMGPANTQVPLISSAPESSQIHNLPLPPPPGPPNYPMMQSHMPAITSQSQVPLQMPGIFNQPLQPPLPHQPRPHSVQQFQHQHHPQMPHNLGFQLTSAPHQHLSQPMFHGQPPLPSQPPPHHFFQGGPQRVPDYNNQAGTSMQGERGGAHWALGMQERAAGGSHLPGPPPLGPGQMVPGLGSAQPPRPPPLTPEMEQALLQQVMGLTPEQINLLPPEQRQQVIQLQEMLR